MSHFDVKRGMPALVSRGPFRLVRFGFRGKKALLIGALLLLLIALSAVFAPWLTHQSPYSQDLNARMIYPWIFGGPDRHHLLGTDLLGRDYLARLIYGARIALMIGLGTVAISLPIGVALGVLGGYFGGWLDLVVTYILMVRLSLPVILVSLAVVGLTGSTLWILMAVLASLLWDRFAVVTRSMTAQLRRREFVMAARAGGATHFSILVNDILPNLLPAIVVIATLEIANAILLEAALSFLGLGVRPPTPSWGLMISEAKSMVYFQPWLINLPGAALLILVFAINLCGDGLRDVLSVKRPTTPSPRASEG